MRDQLWRTIRDTLILVMAMDCIAEATIRHSPHTAFAGLLFTFLYVLFSKSSGASSQPHPSSERKEFVK